MAFQQGLSLFNTEVPEIGTSLTKIFGGLGGVLEKNILTTEVEAVLSDAGWTPTGLAKFYTWDKMISGWVDSWSSKDSEKDKKPDTKVPDAQAVGPGSSRQVEQVEGDVCRRDAAAPAGAAAVGDSRSTSQGPTDSESQESNLQIPLNFQKLKTVKQVKQCRIHAKQILQNSQKIKTHLLQQLRGTMQNSASSSSNSNNGDPKFNESSQAMTSLKTNEALIRKISAQTAEVEDMLKQMEAELVLKEGEGGAGLETVEEEEGSEESETTDSSTVTPVPGPVAATPDTSTAKPTSSEFSLLSLLQSMNTQITTLSDALDLACFTQTTHEVHEFLKYAVPKIDVQGGGRKTTFLIRLGEEHWSVLFTAQKGGIREAVLEVEVFHKGEELEDSEGYNVDNYGNNGWTRISLRHTDFPKLEQERDGKKNATMLSPLDRLLRTSRQAMGSAEDAQKLVEVVVQRPLWDGNAAVAFDLQMEQVIGKICEYNQDQILRMQS